MRALCAPLGVPEAHWTGVWVLDSHGLHWEGGGCGVWGVGDEDEPAEAGDYTGAWGYGTQLSGYHGQSS